MKNFRKIISILTIIVILITSTAITSFAGGGYEPTFTSGNFIYKNCYFDNGIEIIGYTDASVKTISIPKQLNGRTVVGIGCYYEPKEGEYAFGSLKNLTSVSIPDSVTIIDSSAFSGCAGLTSITIPNSVTNIFSHAFKGCTSLTSITIPNSVKEIDEWAFAGCTKLTSITISDSVTEIDRSAFDETGYYNNKANWKDDVLYIGNILLQAKPTITGTYSIKSGTKVIAGSAFENCKSLTGITIPDSVVSIGYSAFWYCENLSSVIIPNGVTSINNYTFRGCTRLTSVTIPNSVTNIGYDAFRYCENLESITIPGSVKSIGEYAFNECTGLTSLTIPNSVTSIGDSAFYECSNLKDVYYGGSKADRDKITIESYNYSLLNATWHYNSTPAVTLGDINADGNINSTDALLALQHSVGKTKLTGDKFTAGDVDKNKIINSSDALKIIQYSVGQITKF